MNSAKHIDFNLLGQMLLGSAETLVKQWFPNGKKTGNEWRLGGIDGDAGQSFAINLVSGKWSDFAQASKGGDLISLYAAKNGLTQVEAARELAEMVGYHPSAEPVAIPRGDIDQIQAPPKGAPEPLFVNARWGPPVRTWRYTDDLGRTLFHVARYNPKEGKKQFLPWSWSSSQGKWINKGWPGVRPIYGLDKLLKSKGSAVIVVEGEKAADAAQRIVGGMYIAVSWCGGAQAIGKTDWSPLAGRDIVLWPDADAPGVSAMRNLAKILAPYRNDTGRIRIVNIEGQPDGWDLADAESEGWDYGKIRLFAKDRCHDFVGAEILDLATERENRKEATALTRKPPPASVYSIWDQAGLICKNNKPLAHLDNLYRLFEFDKSLGDNIWYDTFHNKIYTRIGGGANQEWSDADDLEVTKLIQNEYGIHAAMDNIVGKAVKLWARNHRRNEFKEWAESLRWDGIQRLPAFFVDHYGMDNSDYIQSVGVNFWRSMVARGVLDECQADTMVILEGPQGSFKSQSLKAIGGKWFAVMQADVSSQKFIETLQGKLLVEIAELDSFSGARLSRIKNAISCQVDRFRVPYDKHAADHPRHCVFGGTTNDSHYFSDTTGNRRWMPVGTKEINLEGIRAVREQLFAEAYADVKQGKPWHLIDGEIAKREQESRRIVDEWEHIIIQFCEGRGPVQVTSILANALGVPLERHDHGTQLRVTRILRMYGYQPKFIRVDGGDMPVRTWARP